jgi:ABC-2 type transport system ATP-binding protein
MSAPAIAIRRLTRTFGDRTILRDITLDIDRGEIFVLRGKNGSGKTTFLEILATLLYPSSGTAAVLGHDVVSDGRAVRTAIGYAPSTTQSFYPRLSGRQNLEFFAAAYGIGPEALRSRTSALLDRVGLAAAARERVERYSDGMKARLSLARALLTDAPVLLLDEPLKSLDREGRETARDLLSGDRRNARTAVWVTHDDAEADSVATRVATLDGGELR